MINPLKIIFFNSIYLGGIKTKLSKNEKFAAGEMTERKCIILFYLKTKCEKRQSFGSRSKCRCSRRKLALNNPFKK